MASSKQQKKDNTGNDEGKKYNVNVQNLLVQRSFEL